jgi:hypothetical protein
MKLIGRVCGYGAMMAFSLSVAVTTARAQSTTPPPTTTSGTTTGTSGTTTTAEEPAKTEEDTQSQLPAPRSSYWSSIGGYELDSHDTGYGFFGPQYVRPLRGNMSFVGSANLNYLSYEYATATGHTSVRSPGVSLMGGVQFGTKNWFLVQAGPSFKRRQVREFDAFESPIQSSRDMDVGVNLGTAVWIDPTSHNNVFGMLNYNAVDGYTWGRIAFKEQVGNRSWQGALTPYVGVEFIGQGNEDIRSQQYGGFVEFTHVPSSVSVMFRGGYKRSSFDFGPDKTGPWFAIGFYHRLR